MNSNDNSGYELVRLLILDSGSLNKVAKELGFTRQYLALIRDGQRPVSEEVRRAVYSSYQHNRAAVRLVRKLHDESLYDQI